MFKVVAVMAGLALSTVACGVDNGNWMPADASTSMPDAAGTDAAVVLPDGLTAVAADDPNVQYVGRFDTGQFSNSVGTTKQPVAGLSASTVTIRFTGTAVGVKLSDQFLYGHPNYFDAVVDGKVVGLLTANPDTTTYPIAANLPMAEHVVSVVKRTESNAGHTQYLGWVIAGAMMAPPERPTRRLEFIGDSITAGVGVDAPNGDPRCSADSWGQPAEDGYKSFGALIGRDLNAESHIIGISGGGLIRNYSFTYEMRTVPQMFDLVFPQPQKDAPVWDPTHTQWVPDAIVIALGTNDFAPGDAASMPPLPPIPDAATFAGKYIDFVTTLRGFYADAQIFAVSSPVQGAGALAAGLTMMESHFAASGDSKVHAILLPQISGTGCTTHPSAAQHVDIAAQIETAMKPALGW